MCRSGTAQSIGEFDLLRVTHRLIPENENFVTHQGLTKAGHYGRRQLRREIDAFHLRASDRRERPKSHF
ncbi:hypothetical protein GCM10010519_32280 [Streptomyces lactacystinicus]